MRFQTYNETLEMAMLRVNSVENAMRTKFSRTVSLDSLRCPVTRSAVHPIEVANVCAKVNSHGYDALQICQFVRSEIIGNHTYSS